MRLHILLVDDDPRTQEAIERWSDPEAYDLSTANSLAAARSLLQQENFDLALVGLELDDGGGLELVAELGAGTGPEAIVLADSGSVESVVESMKQGAVDYLEKPVQHARLHSSLISARRRAELRNEVRSLRSELKGMGTYGGLVGASPAMQRVYELMEQVAPTDAPVLITGETGTGKEVVAQAIHRLSGRAGGDFVPLNCAAVPEGVIESELFGHEKGAFTGATRARRGVFARADGGTLLLDEITEMPIDLQPRLLRVLETGEFLPVGSESPEATDCRLVASTNRDPARAVEDGALREDLLYRINVFPISLPPLREREGDAELIARQALKQLNAEHETAKRLAPAAIEQLEQYDWPGNVRELLNVVQRAFILADERIERLPTSEDGSVEPSGSVGGLRAYVGRSIAEVEKELVLATLEAFGGNKKRTAETLQISLKTLYTRLNRYGEEAEEVLRRASSAGEAGD
jgi:two-component system response regulator AtoC